MSEISRNLESKTRVLGGTEQNWCKAVASGTGITILALQVSKEPNISHLQNALHKIQNDHPILTSMLHKNTSTGSYSFTNPPNPNLHVNVSSLSKTSELLRTLTTHESLSPFHMILEHELNINEWARSSCIEELYLCFANVYTLADEKWVLVLRLHTVVCDRTTAVSLLKELKEVEGGANKEIERYKEKVNLGIEEMIPYGKAKKTLWAHGKDMVTYSVNSLRLTNLKFKDVKGHRISQVVRLKMNTQETHVLMTGCKSRGIKLCGALAAAALMATHSSRHNPNSNRLRKYGVIFLNDCRSFLKPPLSTHNFGFYHSAISTIHEVKGGETLWDMAMKSYKAFENSKNANKHFSDMADLNFLMSKAIENPSLTPSSSLRSSLVTVFEDPVIETSNDMEKNLGLDDYIGCSSVHGIGPSIALFDTIRDGQLDCACVYPSPLHSRDQMLEFIANMKKNLVHGSMMKLQT